MAPKIAARKAFVTGASGSDRQVKEEPNMVGATFDDTSRLLEKEGEKHKWVDVYCMFTKSNFSIEIEDQDELKIFINIRRSRIFKVTAHIVVFTCVDAISWIIKHVDMGNRCVHNSKGEPIKSFQPEDMAKCCHLEKGEKNLENNLLNYF
jgi:hypothetical protein